MTSRERWSAVVAGLAAGAAGGLFGVGGGLVLVPVLTAFFHRTQHEAHGTSLAVISLTTAVSLVVYSLYGNVDWLTAALVALPTLVTARLGARLAGRFSPRSLARVFAVFLALVALRLLWKAPEALDYHVTGSVARLVFAGVLGLAVGLVSGFLGVGGGIIAVPAFVLLLGMPQHLAQGTSLAIIVVAAPAGTFEHHRQRNVIWKMVPILAAGSAVGGPLASLFAQHLHQTLLARAFAIFLLANAVRTWMRAGRPSRAKSAAVSSAEHA